MIFGPKPRDYSQKMNRKERRLALRTALMSRVEDLIVVQDFADHLPRPKTKELVTALQRWGIEPEQKVLLLVEDIAEMVALSARNVPTLKLLRADQLNVFDLLYADRIVATTGAIAKIQEVYGD